MLDLRHISRFIRVFVLHIQNIQARDNKSSQTSKGLCVINKLITGGQDDSHGKNGAVSVRKIYVASYETLELFPYHPLNGGVSVRIGDGT